MMERDARSKIVRKAMTFIDCFLKKCGNSMPEVKIDIYGKSNDLAELHSTFVLPGDGHEEDAGKACLSCYLRGAKIGGGITKEMFPDDRDRDIFCTLKMSQTSGMGIPLIEVFLWPKKFRGGNYTDEYVCQLYLICSSAANKNFYEQRMREQLFREPV
jgi:hypothetical protein